MELLIIFAALFVLGVAANVWGAKTTDSRDWHDRFGPWGTSYHHG